MSDERDDNVVPFPRGQFEKAMNEHESALDQLMVRRADRTREGCDHLRVGVYVSAADRTVTCRGCGVAMDPIAVLDSIAGSREMLVHQGRALRNERDYLRVEVEKLKRAEANAKARIRAARKRLASADEADALENAARHAADTEAAIGWDGLHEGSKARYRRVALLAVEGYFGAAAQAAVS